MTAKEGEKIRRADVKIFQNQFYRLCTGYTHQSGIVAHKEINE